MKNANPRILMLEDSRLDAELIAEHLQEMEPKPDLRQAVNRRQYVEALEAGDIDLILSDFSLPDFDGMAALEMARQRAPNVPFIFVSGILGEEAAIESFRRGATDYVLKQRLIRLPAAAERALAEARQKAEHLRAQQQTELLVRELSHRVKNTMAMVMSLVRRTARSSRSVEAYSESLLGRIRAMADAHALLFETNWGHADLAEVVRRTLAPHVAGRDDRLVVDAGPAVSLEPKQALSLSMVFNELATNAVKYGSLSQPSGQVLIKWNVDRDDAEPRVCFTWMEKNGPPVVPPGQEGFGSTLIQRSITYELQGEVELQYLAEGLSCRICVPLG